MKGTYEMMKRVLSGKEGKYSDLELIQEYKLKLSPNILAYFYCKNYGVLHKLSSNYPLLNDEDKASICLQVLDRSLQTYNESSKVKFLTYFIKCFKNKLLEYQHRKLGTDRINVSTLSLDECENIISDYDIEIEHLGDVFNTYKLNTRDRLYCTLLNNGYSVKDIANYMNVTIGNVYKNINKIKEIFSKNSIKIG